MCMAMDPLEWREYAPMASGVNQILAVPTQGVSSLRNQMMFEALTKRRS